MEGSSEASVAALMERMRVAGAGKTCGWKALDNRDVGFFPGELAIVAGRTGHGKTTVILNLLLHWLENYPNDRFILYSYEIPAESVLIKLVSSLTRKIGANDIKDQRRIEQGRGARQDIPAKRRHQPHQDVEPLGLDDRG